ncbi:hypothetical protein B0H67DRAFT_300581 [Lasiosphaeris hirsuta]|uniref:Uncharacterized protein n=1 Tax=Lasiosphaeris hirsuta TaxID=260670 RepID=A0AA40A9K3_9PEZI|nr:hypothetical protein B0H67DRAFT_300581 [Lasiosphaeris hirsuta]
MPSPQKSNLSPSQEAYLDRVRKQAPNRCEICDVTLPTFEDRTKHVATTKHCACFECKRYVPPGCVYSHWCNMHNDLAWNDHQISGGDVSTLRKALPWVREAYQAKLPGVDVDEWLGLKPPKPPTRRVVGTKIIDGCLHIEFEDIPVAEQEANAGSAEAGKVGKEDGSD